MTMGCGSSKKLLQESPSERVVTTTLLAEGSPSREAGTRSSGDKPYAKRKLSGQKTKGEKYKARFDIRVTKEYEIKALIGRGSFSRVVRVEHYQTKQPYAIKMMEIEQGKDEFQSELAVLRRVKHEFVVRLYEVFECRNRVYLVMELATGGVLLDRILSKGFFTERDATRVIYMVLEGVRYLHSLGITHRDLKPENLLYYHPGNDSKIMITDFGLSNLRKHPDDRTMETTCGTPGYMAPEVLLSKPYTNSVDIWSIGVITFNVLSGQMPFADDHRSRLYKKILRGKFSFSGEPWDDVTDMAKDFINKLIVYEPEMRLTAEQGIKHPWIASSAATSSLKNLHKSISQNLLKSRGNSAKSNRSQKSNRSIRSVISRHLSNSQTHQLQLSNLQEKEAEVAPSTLRDQRPLEKATIHRETATTSQTVHKKQYEYLHKQLDGPTERTQEVSLERKVHINRMAMEPQVPFENFQRSSMPRGSMPHTFKSVPPTYTLEQILTRRSDQHQLAPPVFGMHIQQSAKEERPPHFRSQFIDMDSSPPSRGHHPFPGLRNNFLGNFCASDEPISKEESINSDMEVSVTNPTTSSLEQVGGVFRPRLSPMPRRNNRIFSQGDDYMC